ncbi:MAG: hypothetical protein AAFX58_07085 [Pseudomonadota bacterium]
MSVGWPCAVAALLLAGGCGEAPPERQGMVAADAAVVVVGLGAGGHMAQQLHFAHSSTIDAAGVIAAGPYGCALGDRRRADGVCTGGGRLDLAAVSHTARDAAAAGDIDTLNHLDGDRVWISPGWSDSAVDDEAVFGAYELYEDYLAPGDAVYGQRCDGAVADCARGLVDVMLAHLRPASPVAGEPAVTTRFVDVPALAAAGIDRRVALTVPAVCEQAGGCGLLLVLAGCDGLPASLRAALDAAAPSRRLLVAYPDVADGAPQPCWDWWGARGADYRSREAPQIEALRALLTRLRQPGDE